MKRNLINTPLFALFAGAFLFESGTAFASSPVIIGEGTYDSAIYATEEDTTGGSSLYINGGTFNLYSSVSNPDLYLYGGGSEGVSITGNTYFRFNAGEVLPGDWSHSLYGGGSLNTTITGSSKFEMNGGSIYGADLNRSAIFGASRPGSVVQGNSQVVINAGTIKGLTIYGGADGANTRFDGQMGTYSHYIDLAETSTVEGNASVTIGENATVYTVVAGGRGNSVIKGNVYLNINGKTSNVNQGGDQYGKIYGITSATFGSTAVTGSIISAGDIYGSNVTFKDDGSVDSVVDANKIVVYSTYNGSTVNGVLQGFGTFGSYDDPVNTVYGSINVKINDGTKVTSNVRSAGLATHVLGNTSLTISGENTNIGGNVYAGSERGSQIDGNATLIIDSATVQGDVYGGGYGIYYKDNSGEYANQDAIIKGNSNVYVRNATVEGGIYAGGKGQRSITEGDATVTLTGTVNTPILSGYGKSQTLGEEDMGKGITLGNRTLNFSNTSDPWSGAITAAVDGFNRIIVDKNTTVEAMNVKMEEAMYLGGSGSLTMTASMEGVSVENKLFMELENELNLTFTGSSFKNNTVANTTQLPGLITGWNSGVVVLKDSVFENNSLTANYLQGGVLYNIAGDSVIENSKFVGTVANGTSDRVRGSVLYFNNHSADVSGSVFEGNTANGYGDNLTAGAVYIENQSDQKQTLTIENSYFENNAAVGHNGYTAMGGAVHALYRSGAGADVVISDTVFTNNSATTKGGAIYVAGESLALNATKSMAYMGNTSAEGGFLYLDENAGKSASASFNISDGAILTIGAAGSGADSIAGVSSASFSKSGAGILTINGDMSGYLGTLNVNAGTMNVNNGLGAGSINIAAGANLGVALSSGALSSSAVVNDGVLSLKRGTLSDRETVSMASYNGSGSVAAFGGFYENGVFTAGVSAEASNGLTVGSADTDVQTVKYSSGGENLVMDFDVSKMGDAKITLESVSAVSDKGNIQGTLLSGFDVVASYDAALDFSVVFSAYVGEGLDVSQISAWHKESGSDVWTLLETDISYDGGMASIVVDGFGSYAFSSIPEPSEIAAALGMLALGFAAFRRRR